MVLALGSSWAAALSPPPPFPKHPAVTQEILVPGPSRCPCRPQFPEVRLGLLLHVRHHLVASCQWGS